LTIPSHEYERIALAAGFDKNGFTIKACEWENMKDLEFKFGNTTFLFPASLYAHDG